jgi:hypothetical protein
MAMVSHEAIDEKTKNLCLTQKHKSQNISGLPRNSPTTESLMPLALATGETVHGIYNTPRTDDVDELINQ